MGCTVGSSRDVWSRTSRTSGNPDGVGVCRLHLHCPGLFGDSEAQLHPVPWPPRRCRTRPLRGDQTRIDVDLRGSCVRIQVMVLGASGRHQNPVSFAMFGAERSLHVGVFPPRQCSESRERIWSSQVWRALGLCLLHLLRCSLVGAHGPRPEGATTHAWGWGEAAREGRRRTRREGTSHEEGCIPVGWRFSPPWVKRCRKR